MKILLLGANGALGRQFQILFKSKKLNFFSVTRENFNFKGNYKDIKKIIELYKPNFIINCIALTGLIYCENKRKEAYEVNTNIPLYLMRAIKKKEIRFIHFSTEAVFNGKKLRKIYSEKDKPKPTSIYGKSKLAADKKVLKSNNSLIIRLPMLYGPTHKNQIISKLLIKLTKGEKIHVANDVFSTPVYTPDLCKFVYNNCIIKSNLFKKKLIHFTSSKKYSIYDFIKNLSKNINAINPNQIIKVKDAFFGNNIKIKPKNLGLTSLYANCIKKTNFKIAKKLI
tara:strand:+ start:319 stop:1164 length:846 start_codon:yes stop_codon:yes gene_type:complete